MNFLQIYCNYLNLQLMVMIDISFEKYFDRYDFISSKFNAIKDT
jgi:hypothetical protein